MVIRPVVWPFALKPLAKSTGWSVLATWVDPMLSGHKFVIDAVVMTDRKQVAYPERLLFIDAGGANFFVLEARDDPAIAIGASGLSVLARPPYRTKAERLLGIARGQAHLQAAIYAGSPYATNCCRGAGRSPKPCSRQHSSGPHRRLTQMRS